MSFLLWICNAVSNISSSVRRNLKGQWKSTGDPTEVALQVFAGKLGLGRPELTGEGPEAEERPMRHAMGKVVDYGVPEHERARLEQPKREKLFDLKVEFPFSSELKRMTTIYEDKVHNDTALVLIKGAVSTNVLRSSPCLTTC